MKDVVRMVVVLTVVCTAAALGLARVHEWTEAPIAEALRQERLRAIRAVLPEFDNAPDADAVTVAGLTYYPGRANGTLVGVAVPVHSGEGYGGDLDALVGVDPTGTVTGVVILTHTETPGLGAKATDPAWLGQFVGKSLDGSQWAVKKDGGDFDQITGATITPRALVKAIHEGLEAYARARDEIGGR